MLRRIRSFLLSFQETRSLLPRYSYDFDSFSNCLKSLIDDLQKFYDAVVVLSDRAESIRFSLDMLQKDVGIRHSDLLKNSVRSDRIILMNHVIESLKNYSQTLYLPNVELSKRELRALSFVPMKPDEKQVKFQELMVRIKLNEREAVNYVNSLMQQVMPKGSIQTEFVLERNRPQLLDPIQREHQKILFLTQRLERTKRSTSNSSFFEEIK